MQKRSLFIPRKHVLPYEYPNLIRYAHAIQDAFWTFKHFTYEDSIQDYQVNAKPLEKSVVTRGMLAISQIEVGVKTFWGNIHHYFPKPEVAIVGAVFSESEVRHFDSYRHILNLLGLNDLFAKLEDYKPLNARVDYTLSILENKDANQQEAIISLALFSTFIEHISLFSQFYIMSSFDKHRNMFSGLSNLILATSKEEELHGKFGIHLCKILKVEHPELFTESFYQKLQAIADEAFEAEMKIVDWIFEAGNLEFLTAENVKEYIKHRYNNSLVALGLSAKYDVDQAEYEKSAWFDATVLGALDVDFFSDADVAYSKGLEFTAEAIFGDRLAPPGT